MIFQALTSDALVLEGLNRLIVNMVLCDGENSIVV